MSRAAGAAGLVAASRLPGRSLRLGSAAAAPLLGHSAGGGGLPRGSQVRSLTGGPRVTAPVGLCSSVAGAAGFCVLGGASSATVVPSLACAAAAGAVWGALSWDSVGKAAVIGFALGAITPVALDRDVAREVATKTGVRDVLRRLK
eukprot:TRINITY_DN24535_c0_g1_i1.p1 TRINITY_DN24535_c0_g1~~TRINITY_DN24535_c0_g1_i1.p1  ORF type:complete len:146 (-),score=25.73 TRINITY_DN24535_c0_g1_i1:252-689(-)